MLRNFVLLLGAFLLAGGAIGMAFHAGPEMLGPLILGALILIGTVFEPHYRGSNQPNPPSSAWERTQESFRDPETGEIVEVWYNKDNGERRYILPGK